MFKTSFYGVLGALPFPSLLSIYKPRFISISLVFPRYGPYRHPLWKMVKGR